MGDGGDGEGFDGMDERFEHLGIFHKRNALKDQ